MADQWEEIYLFQVYTARLCIPQCWPQLSTEDHQGMDPELMLIQGLNMAGPRDVITD